MAMIQRITFLLVLVTLTGCTHFIFQPLRPHYMSPDVLGVIYEDITIRTSDNIRLHGWKLLAEDNINGSVLFFHGNAENISTHFANVYWLTEQGFDVYLFDYRGYGKSEGVPQLDAIVSDMDTMIGYVVKQIPDEEKLNIIGHSLGGSLAIYAVAHSDYRDRIKLLVSVEAFSDYRDVTQDALSTSWLTWLFQWPFSFTVDNSYRPIDAVGEVAPVPLVIMHSKYDEMIPFYHAEELYAAAREPKKLEFIEGAHIHVFNISENRQLLLNYLNDHR
jgi:hypothetical protein